MNPSRFTISLALLVLDDIGLEIRAITHGSKIPENDVVMIANFYSPIVQASSTETGIYGPLPVPKYHDKYNILVALFEHYDSQIRDKRALSSNSMARCFMLIFYNKKYDQRMTIASKDIFRNITDYFNKLDDMSQLEPEMLDELSTKLVQESIEKEKNLKIKDIREIVYEIGNRINTIEMLATTLTTREKIAIISEDILTYKLIIQGIFALQNIDYVLNYSLTEWGTKVETCGVEYYLSRLFELETLGEPSFPLIKDANYILYIAPCSERSQVYRHFRNIDRFIENNPSVLVMFIITDPNQLVTIDVKKVLLEEEMKRPNVYLLVSIGTVYRSLENAIFKIVNKLLEKREKQLKSI